MTERMVPIAGLEPAQHSSVIYLISVIYLFGWVNNVHLMHHFKKQPKRE